MKASEPSSLRERVRRQVNKYGELHLDRTFTDLLLQELKLLEREQEASSEFVREILRIIKDSTGASRS